MRPEILDIFVCPACSGGRPFSVHAEEENDREIRTGKVICEECKGEFPIREGIFDALPNDKIREEVANEIDGWIDAYRPWFDLEGKSDNFWLASPENEETRGISSDEFLRRLPDYEKIGKDFHERSGHQTLSYRELMDSIEIDGSERVLDLGAARCWTTRDFAKLGCDCVAIDIVKTKYIGLGSSDVYFEEDPSAYWERVCADMEQMPFIDDSFDIVFANAVLHHTKDLRKVLRQVRRILKPGGRLLVVNEPDYGLFDYSRQKKGQEEEASLGVNENLYSHRFLAKTLRKEGFVVDFYSPVWNIDYLAWKTTQSMAKKVGLKRTYRIQMFLRNSIMARQNWVRLLIGLGTMGVATKKS